VRFQLLFGLLCFVIWACATTPRYDANDPVRAYERSCRTVTNRTYRRIIDRDPNEPETVDVNYLSRRGFAAREHVHHNWVYMHWPTRTWVVPPKGVIRSRTTCDMSLMPDSYDDNARNAKKSVTFRFGGIEEARKRWKSGRVYHECDPSMIKCDEEGRLIF